MKNQGILILSAGSPLVADLEETCARARIPIAAIIRGDTGKEFALDPSLLLDAQVLTDVQLRSPVITPMMTSGLRQRAYRRLSAVLGAERMPRFATVIDPTSIVARSASLGEGSYVNAGVVIGAASEFGAHCVLNRGCVLGHHLEVADYVTIAPGAVVQGDVVIERGATICSNATINEYARIGANSVVGMGSVVMKDVPPNTVVWGNPAKVMKTGVAGYKDIGVLPDAQLNLLSFGKPRGASLPVAALAPRQ
ncbi:MAG: acetyltransferase [Pseudomonadota bacterium]